MPGGWRGGPGQAVTVWVKAHQRCFSGCCGFHQQIVVPWDCSSPLRAAGRCSRPHRAAWGKGKMGLSTAAQHPYP